MDDGFLEPIKEASETERSSSPSVKDVLIIGSRHKRFLFWTFAAVALLAIAYVLLVPPSYEAETKILVRHDRVDPVVSPDANSAVTRVIEDVSQNEMNSEVEILLSEEVLRNVVDACHLAPQGSTAITHDRAVRRLKDVLDVEPVKNTNVIVVKYRSRNPQLAAAVLQALNKAYVERHLAAHRPGGELKFFEQQTERHRALLQTTEQQLENFSNGHDSVRPDMVRDQMLQQLTALRGAIASTNAEIASTQSRIRTLENEEQAVPARMTTTVKRLDNPQLLQQLKGTLLDLQLKRTQLLSKYQESYRPVQEIEQEIASAEKAIAAAEAAPLRENTTDVQPTHNFIEGEMVKAKADLDGLRARATAMQTTMGQYQLAVHELQQKGIMEQDLLREIKSEEQNYLLYQQKREESRITDALDQMRILNVGVIEEPAVPALPVHSAGVRLLPGLLAAAFLSVGAVFLANHFDHSIHTAHEIEVLDIPVLATVRGMSADNGDALPIKHGDSHGANGNGLAGEANRNSDGRWSPGRVATDTPHIDSLASQHGD